MGLTTNSSFFWLVYLCHQKKQIPTTSYFQETAERNTNQSPKASINTNQVKISSHIFTQAQFAHTNIGICACMQPNAFHTNPPTHSTPLKITHILTTQLQFNHNTYVYQCTTILLLTKI